MKKTVCTALIMIVFGMAAHAQNTGSNYTTALGVKFYPGAITIKHFNRTNRALEGLIYFYEDGMRFTGLYEIHGNVQGAEGLRWYIGPGAHIGFWSDKWKNNNPDEDGGVTIGVDGVLGLDYKIKGAPINLSLDWQPSFNFIGYTYFEAGWAGLAVRYTF